MDIIYKFLCDMIILILLSQTLSTGISLLIGFVSDYDHSFKNRIEIFGTNAYYNNDSLLFIIYWPM